ncbi:hypothetical protein O6H91_Y033500 [Diphasiastrum complanatum]|nr:hypothetical protein O6H91_Y553800 [Diphasiastrum complanatum]KAJ7231871.1 hypothetical protein O6H91_Y456500 [Diphasiastrum complanatum]KAJ7276058.1 hypothetical protein O6H91_Y392600 [Diphasiastrum complanatum]KAJ7297048.1 hypothetical protein O6H91_Y082900 [Diphasiastrum complanatum]KAJ7297860.1 hypothetical protein O6H91_Y033500 [Diphasiastrum complanatum]
MSGPRLRTRSGTPLRWRRWRRMQGSGPVSDSVRAPDRNSRSVSAAPWRGMGRPGAAPSRQVMADGVLALEPARARPAIPRQMVLSTTFPLGNIELRPSPAGEAHGISGKVGRSANVLRDSHPRSYGRYFSFRADVSCARRSAPRAPLPWLCRVGNRRAGCWDSTPGRIASAYLMLRRSAPGRWLGAPEEEAFDRPWHRRARSSRVVAHALPRLQSPSPVVGLPTSKARRANCWIVAPRCAWTHLALVFREFELVVQVAGFGAPEEEAFHPPCLRAWARRNAWRLSSDPGAPRCAVFGFAVRAYWYT